MEVVDAETPDALGPGEVLLAPEAVGLCGSDFHYFLGDIGALDDPASLYPRIQGHEAAAVIVELGADAPSHLAAGMRVAIWPVRSCGRCYPCRIGRGNACVRISLTGIHADGALQERLVLPVSHVSPTGDLDPGLTALVEPVSIAVRAVARGRVAPGEHVVILGAGPIGQALALAATDLGASALLVDKSPVASPTGPPSVPTPSTLHRRAACRPPSGSGPDGDGPEVVFEATGVPGLVQTAVELVAGRPRGRRRALERARPGARRRPTLQGDRPHRDELLAERTTLPEPSISSAGDAMPSPVWSRTSSRSSRHPRRLPMRSSIPPR